MSASTNQLCSRCADIQFNFFMEPSLKDRDNEKLPEISWTTLRTDYCQFCQLLDHCRSRSQDTQTSSRGTLRGVYNGHELQFYEDEDATGMRLDYSIRKCGPTSLSRLNEKPQSSNKFDVNELKHWLGRCKSHECLPGDLSYAPPPEGFRLIDVQMNRIVRVKTHVKYCALSYVWGEHKQSWPTSRADLVSENSLDGLKLPKTILDAIALCRDIECPYLWVDSLCIHNSEADKHRQILAMADIYSQSFLAIVATAGDDADAGLPPYGDLGRSLDVSYLVRSFPHGNFVASLSPQIAAQQIAQSSWASRGWTLQEHALSRRLLLFTGTYAFFRCEKGLWCEDFGLGFSDCFTEDLRWDLPLPRFYKRIPNPGRHYSSTFSQLLAQFIRRDLRYENDILAAFTGILTRMKDSIGTHIWGLPTKEFGVALQWTTGLPFPSTERCGFPSWSWAGWVHAKSSDPLDGASNDIYDGFDNLTTNISVVTCYVVGDDGEVLTIESYNFERVSSQLRRANNRHPVFNKKKEIARLEGQLQRHFNPPPCPDLQTYIELHTPLKPPLSQHIFLWVSCASLYVDQPSNSTKYLEDWDLPIRIAKEAQPIGSIRLDHKWREKQVDKMEFFVSTVGACSKPESVSQPLQLKFKIILIKPHLKTKPPVYKRIQVSHTEICQTDWSLANPTNRLIALV